LFPGSYYEIGIIHPQHIAEGFERITQRECITFLNYARGSCGELRTQILVGMEIRYIPEEIGQGWVKEAKEISSMLSNLIKTKTRFLHQSKS
jgi:four helix bundle protein